MIYAYNLFIYLLSFQIGKMKINLPSKQQTLSLYRNILRYGQSLEYTNKEYFYKRLRGEFKRNKNLPEDKINFYYQVKKKEHSTFIMI